MVAHFEQRIPTGLFDYHAASFDPNALTTAAAITSTCLLKLVAMAADRVGVQSGRAARGFAAGVGVVR